ncbi:hypothetical protein SAMN04487826_0090 [Prevotella sp. khp1]|jgi:hypothetical protein|uniref:hypothetical protein n=1 Tax=Prevotellaceae TaxID=171552 RepID=UPI00088CA171|nr:MULTISPECIES: hypothetical protein [Prevotellaceae]QVJ81342.1 hypothetical protein J4031_02825 [Xylanibacter ruminicola]SDQ04296.1 hypothetical protein SAMN04487826_0090 [Prevotella sp. khp1]
MEKNNKKDIFNKQVELYFKEVSKAVETATDKCIETDGKVLPHSIAVGLGKTLGASLAAFTKGASDSVANDIIELSLEIVKETALYYRAELDIKNKEN